MYPRHVLHSVCTVTKKRLVVILANECFYKAQERKRKQAATGGRVVRILNCGMHRSVLPVSLDHAVTCSDSSHVGCQCWNEPNSKACGKAAVLNEETGRENWCECALTPDGVGVRHSREQTNRPNKAHICQSRSGGPQGTYRTSAKSWSVLGWRSLDYGNVVLRLEQMKQTKPKCWWKFGWNENSKNSVIEDNKK